jgi:hypothetical protein
VSYQTRNPVHLSLLMSPYEGVKIAECDSPLLRAIEIPRDSLRFVSAIPELDTAGLYVLLSEVQAGESQVLVGAAQALSRMLERRAASLNAWRTAIFITSRFSAWSLEELSLLEQRLNLKISPGNATALPGGTVLPGDPASLIGAAEVEAILRLLELLGHRLETPRAPREATDLEDLLYYCSTGPVLGKGRRSGAQFTVLAGSVGRRAAPESLSPVGALQLRLIEAGDVRVCGESLIFQSDCLFPSQAQAAGALLGHASSGFFDWKRGNGQTLGQIERFIDIADEPRSS